MTASTEEWETPFRDSVQISRKEAGHLWSGRRILPDGKVGRESGNTAEWPHEVVRGASGMEAPVQPHQRAEEGKQKLHIGIKSSMTDAYSNGMDPSHIS